MNHKFINQKFIDKFTKLRFRISFKARESHSLGELEVINDMKWVKRKIEDWEANRVPDKIDLKVANNMWKRYSNNPPTDIDWDVIDECLLSGRKIHAIKLYRNMKTCGLREAKNVIDERYEKFNLK